MRTPSKSLLHEWITIQQAERGQTVLIGSSYLWRQIVKSLPKGLKKDAEGAILFPTGGKLVKYFKGE
jgi:hypothetical protein